MTTETLSPEIEKEIQARIEFKMNEFMTGLKNTIAYQRGLAFRIGSHPSESYRLEAMEKIQESFLKEVRMGTPYDEMYLRKKHEAKERAVNNIRNLLDTYFRGRCPVSEFEHKIKYIANQISIAQNI